ncbi:MAG: RidA family protein [Anaerolineales bacterium]|nr:RidA family protein [Anaerolineales bacterium]MCB0016447.1 RidA family protein [Anaerolineales bacterium]
MTKKNIISTEKAPAAVGPYSQAIRIGKLLYTAGQIALVPATGKMLEGDVSAQAEQVLNNLTAVLEAGGSSLANVVKTTVFLTDMGNYAAMNEVYSRFFGDSKPARSAVAVAALPLGALVEIEAVALVDKKKKDGKKKKK